MSEHLTEEEQLEALKRWWDENGKSTVIGVVLAVAGYFGWEGYQAQQQNAAEAASLNYQNLVEAMQAQIGSQAAPSEEQQATARHLAKILKEEHPSSLYAAQAALFMAQQAQQQGDLDKAAEELQWILEAGVERPLELLVTSRLARIQFAQQNYDGAIATAADADSGVFKAAFAEIRGDALLAKGDAQAARAAYQMAINNLQSADRSRQVFLEMKLNDIQVSAPLAINAEPVTDTAQGEG